MTKRSTSHPCARVVCLSAAIALVFSVWAAPTVAQSVAQSDSPDGGFGLRIGYNDNYRRLGLVYETPTWWSHRSDSGWGRLDLGAELEAAYWHSPNRDPDSMWQISATPMLRWWPTDHFFAEIGVGVTALSRTQFAGKQLGSAFQFGNHIGVGTIINDAHRVGVRYSHYSNAGIKRPNPGLDLIQLTYTYQY